MNAAKGSSSRNAPCRCGSGRRFKDCCGSIGSVSTTIPSAVRDSTAIFLEALSAQRARNLTHAEALYRRGLAAEPDHADGLHMLGVIRMERGDLTEAASLMQRALDLTHHQVPAILHNFGLLLAKLAHAKSHARLSQIGQAYRERRTVPRASDANALVSIILPSYNHAQYVEAAVRSVFNQSYAGVELIAIDDGSRDGSAQVLRSLQAASPIPFKLIARENQGASATLNELVALCSGEWIQPLNSDDILAPDRVETMLAAVHAAGSDWGFGGVRCIGAHGEPIDELSDGRVFELRCAQAQIGFEDTVGDNFYFRNPAISTGNLFLRAALVRSVGGFACYRYHHDWDFCLHALRIAEPVYSVKPTYFYRFHETNTISEASAVRRDEADAMMRAHLDTFFANKVTNPWAPTYASRGTDFLSRVLSSGMGALVRPERLSAVAETLMVRNQSQSI
ncbi:MAG TPA: glycosyltransferase [Casimicrobium sp.]|nr:glycosyltransferase [Casimicrobium sp.]